MTDRLDDPHIPAIQTEAIRALFREHGYDGGLLVVDESADEAIFLVSTDAILFIREPSLTIALQALLGRKVWVVDDASPFRRQARAFD